MNMYLIPGQSKILFQKSFTFSSFNIRVLTFPGKFIKSPHLWGRPIVYLFLWYNTTHLFYINLLSTLTHNC